VSAARADRVEPHLGERELDALLVTNIVHIRWLTGFTGTNAFALLGGGGFRRFATDFRYLEQAEAQVVGFERVQAPRELLEGVAAVLPADELRLGFDDADVSVRQHARLGELLPDGVELVAAGGLIERERAIKEESEIERIGAAAALADEAFAELLEGGIVGRTERELALSLEDGMRRRGASAPSFPSIVAAGAHGARPHAEPRDVEVPAGTLVVVDWGADLDGYCSDCTRTVATGELDGEATKVYELVRRAQEAALGAVRAGPTGAEVDAVARDLIEAAGHGERFGHGLGHGVGLEVHEEPRLSRVGRKPLVAGNVVTIEPGVYIPGRFGVRIEDLVAVTDDGARVLSSFPKKLTRVG
jgi:Xaa-Pro aminopeptidase